MFPRGERSYLLVRDTLRIQAEWPQVRVVVRWGCCVVRLRARSLLYRVLLCSTLLSKNRPPHPPPRFRLKVAPCWPSCPLPSSLLPSLPRTRRETCCSLPPVQKIYDHRTDSVVVSPFPVYVDPHWLLRMLALPDRELLARTSTSPEAEDERFVADIRAQLSFMVAQSGPDGRAWLENVFGGGRGTPLVFPRAEAGAGAGGGGRAGAAVGAVGQGPR